MIGIIYLSPGWFALAFPAWILLHLWRLWHDSH